MKIGLMGGTFDPPHKAHIAMASAALKEFDLNNVVFMTGGNPPHKIAETDAKIRHHMMKLAIESYDKFIPCDYEINKKDYSYTADTLKYLTNVCSNDEFYFIIGGDSFKAIFSWHKPEDILRRCVLLIYPRDGFPAEKDIIEFNKSTGADARILHAEMIGASSTEIRDMISKKSDVSEYLNVEVFEYIKRNSLYIKNSETQEEHLEKMISNSRYAHSIGVAATAVQMAGIYGVNPQKAYVAGLLHDCAKNLSPEEVALKCVDLEVELDEFEREQFGLIHSKIGAELVKTEFGINDTEICNAIRWHTLGRVGMGNLEKIIFVADMIEPNRKYKEVEFLRNCAFSDLDAGVLECVSAIIEFNEKKGETVHPNAYKIKEWLLKDGVKRFSQKEAY